MLPQAARLAKIFLSVMGNIQVDFVRQAHDLALDGRRVNMDEDQVDIRRAAQQEILAQQTPAQVRREDTALLAHTLGYRVLAIPSRVSRLMRID